MSASRPPKQLLSVSAGTLFVSFLIAPLPALAGVVMDGTLGRGGALSGPNYAITANLGRQQGNNLFQSFSEFNLVKNDIATFSGPSSVTNIISRVTGGSASSIDGTVKSTIDGANLYFVNPHGIMFGPNARLDVSGSFHATTADYLKLGSDGRFDAQVPENSLLTSAPPSAFGFASATPAQITLTDSFLDVPEGQTLSLIGGNLSLLNRIDYTLLYVPGGRLNLAAVASVGELELTGAGIDSSSFGSMGDISITRTALDRNYYDLLTSSRLSGGGSIYLSGGRFVVDNAWIASASSGSGNGNDLVIEARESVDLKNDAELNVATESRGNAGSTTIETAKLTLNDARIINSTWGEGSGGNIVIKASDSISLSNGGSIYVTAEEGTGNAGTAAIETAKLNIDGYGSRITGSTWAAGRGGILTITASDSVNLTNGGFISVGAGGSGNGGGVTIETARLSLTGDESNYSSIFGVTSSTGSGGNLSVRAAESIALNNGGRIYIASEDSGDAGTAMIDTATLTVDDSSIAGVAYSSGIGGTLSIKASDSINLAHGGSIGVIAYSGSGDAGTASIETSRLNMDYSTITGLTWTSGKGGSLSIKASDSLTMTNWAHIYVDTVFGTGDAGTATIETARLSLDDSSIAGSTLASGKGGSLAISASDSIRLSNQSSITVASEFGGGDGGTAIIETANLIMDYSSIAASTSSGKGGDLAIKANDSLSLTNRSKITVSALAGSGEGGTVTIETGRLNVEGSGSHISGLTLSEGKGGTVTIKASDSITLSNGGAIYVTAESGSSGDAGTALLETVRLNLDGDGTCISGETASAGKGGSLTIMASDSVNLTNKGSIYVTAEPGSTGNAGTATIETARLSVDGAGSYISGETTSEGKGGTLNIKATDAVNLTNRGAIIVTAEPGSTGSAGTATIETARLNVDGYYSLIGGSTFSAGTGGSLSIKASDSIALTNGGIIAVTAEEGSSGNAGSAAIETPRLSVDASYISGRTLSTGNGGTLTIIAGDSVTLTNGTALGDAIAVSAEAGSSGEGGDIFLTTDRLIMQNNTSIASESNGTGKAGDITLQVGSLLKLYNSSITTETANANGGSIFIDPAFIDMKESRITTSVHGGTGNGGNIDLAARNLVLDRSSIIANAEGGNGGNINLNSETLIQSAHSVISASSRLGLQGSVFISSPLIDLGASLAVMPDSILDINALLPKRCAATDEEISSFTALESPPAPAGPDRPLAVP